VERRERIVVARPGALVDLVENDDRIGEFATTDAFQQQTWLSGAPLGSTPLSAELAIGLS
jgi:hypothetical protein